jgi:hypothetical protein
MDRRRLQRDPLRLLADKTGGIFEHVSDVNEIVKLLPKAAVTKVGAQDVTVDMKSEGQVKLFNFEGTPGQVERRRKRGDDLGGSWLYPVTTLGISYL